MSIRNGVMNGITPKRLMTETLVDIIPPVGRSDPATLLATFSHSEIQIFWGALWAFNSAPRVFIFHLS